MKYLESFAIRFLWVWRATSLKKMPGLCPPQCSEGHTYKWPCRARIRRIKKIKGYRGSFPPIYDEVEKKDDRDPLCVEKWPGCYSGGYNPLCCRFPKSCSPTTSVRNERFDEDLHGA